MNREKYFPKKLSAGDEIRIVSPAMSLGIISSEVRKIAMKRMTEMGLKVSFSEHCEEMDDFQSSSVKSRVKDLHDAFADHNVKAVLTTIGGYNSNQILRYLDYALIRKNPKIFCGYSDITHLQNAIYAKTGLVIYSGAHFSTFGCLKGIEYVVEYFQKCLFEHRDISIEPSVFWSDDAWYLDQENRIFENNSGYHIIRAGRASGTIIGGNINALNNLQGTEYMPSFEDAVLFLEDDYLTTPEIFDRCLQALILLKDFHQVKGLVIGRFQRAAKMTNELLTKIIHSKKELESIPVIACVDFGHTYPMFTFPVGGHVEFEADVTTANIRIGHR